MKVFVAIPQNTIPMMKFLPNHVKQYLEERFEVIYLPFDRHPTREEFVQYAEDAEAVVTGWGSIPMDGELMKKTNIKLVVHTGGSVGGYVNDEVYDLGIKVISGNDLYADSVAEGVLAYMLTALRKIPDYVECTRKGGWDIPELPTEGILDQSVGLIGMGAISKRVVKLLQPFGVSLKLYSGYPIDEKYLNENNAVQASLEEIFSTCKIVSLHSAMNERTRGMIGKEHFDLLKNGAVFLNTARGRIIREEEMIEALKENRFRAILDVYYEEPLAQDSELRKLKNVYCIPHKGGPTADRAPFITKKLIDDMMKFEKGESLKLEITREYAARMTVGG